MHRIGSIDSGDLLESLSVPYVDLSSEITESSDTEETSLRVVREEVARVCSEIVDDLDASIENDSLCGHIYIEKEGFSIVPTSTSIKEQENVHP